MNTNLKFRFRMYQRKRTYYVEDIQTGQQESLHTKDPVEAARLLNAKNETTFLAGSNLQVARAYMVASDPHMPERDWQEVVDFIIDQKAGPNKHRWQSFSKDRALKQLWKMRVVETRADQHLTMLKKGTVSTNVYLTHHAPSPHSEEPGYANGPLSPSFVSDLGPLIEQSGMLLWIHGHTHCNVDYRLSANRVFRRAELRRITKLSLLEVKDRATHLNGH